MAYRCPVCFDSFCPGCEDSLLAPEADLDPYAGHVPADVPLGRTETLWPDAVIDCETCGGWLRVHNDPAEDFCPACLAADGASPSALVIPLTPAPSAPRLAA